MSLLNMNMPSEGSQIIMRNIREQRLSRNWTQQALSERSGVSLSTLRKFEQTGKISLESFVKICFCLDLLDDLISLTEPKEQEFTSMDQLLEKSATKKRQRARGK
ncbi:helix-turn-helix transcriptional regulator [Maridesulfovibrio sp.]|uniref:helix-turn-helix domain-containing protein n=1 Tax=Maridesulfovibrio sp. TaxID=2795000 RepID=UPI0029CA5A6B|nr:helix-turn-helix transcriptional regulator [Maridesulfovibrio sp.]